jgi:hypothetical protein
VIRPRRLSLPLTAPSSYSISCLPALCRRTAPKLWRPSPAFSPYVLLEAHGPDFPRVADIECSIGSSLPPSQRIGTLTFPDAITFLKYFLCPKCMLLRRPKLVEDGEQWTIGQVSIVRLCTKYVLFLMLLDRVPFPSSTPADGF